MDIVEAETHVVNTHVGFAGLFVFFTDAEAARVWASAHVDREQPFTIHEYAAGAVEHEPTAVATLVVPSR